MRFIRKGTNEIVKAVQYKGNDDSLNDIECEFEIRLLMNDDGEYTLNERYVHKGFWVVKSGENTIFVMNDGDMNRTYDAVVEIKKDVWFGHLREFNGNPNVEINLNVHDGDMFNGKVADLTFNFREVNEALRAYLEYAKTYKNTTLSIYTKCDKFPISFVFKLRNNGGVNINAFFDPEKIADSGKMLKELKAVFSRM